MSTEADRTQTTAAFRVGDRVRMSHDHGTSMAVPLGREGVVVEVSSPTHIVVDFGHPYGERGCQAGQHLEKLS